MGPSLHQHPAALFLWDLLHATLPQVDVQLRPRFKCQVVARDVVGLEGDHLAQLLEPLLRLLPRDPEYEIETQGFETHLTRQPEGPHRPLHIVGPVQEAKSVLVEGLHTQAQPLHSKLQEEGQLLLAGTLWVGLAAVLLDLAQIYSLGQALQESPQEGRRDVSGRATAQEDGLGLEVLTPKLQFTQYRLDDGLLQSILDPREGVEVTVPTLDDTEWNVSIQG